MKKIVFLGILVFIISLCIGYIYSSLFFGDASADFQAEQVEINNIEDYAIKDNIYTEVIEASTDADVRVSPNANFAIKQNYDECNHFDFKYSKLPEELVNLTRQEVEDYYNEYEIEEFDSNNVVLSKEINGYCSEHFFIKLGDNNVEVMQLDTDGSFIPYKETEITREYLTKEDISNLEEGLYVYGSGNINSILEDYE